MKTQTVSKTNRIAKHQNGDAAVPVQASRVATIAQLRIASAVVVVTGKSPLIVHAWSAKAVRMMLEKQMGTASAGREKKNPLEDFRQSLYVLPNKQGFGMPCICFKAAIVSAANDVGLKMTECKRGIHVSHDLVKIECPPLAKELYTDWDTKHAKELEFEHSQGVSMRMDLVRLESGVADIRFRGCFPVWKCTLPVEYNEALYSLDQVTNLINAAGQSGVGEWRPSSPQVRSGEYGRFQVQLSQ